MLGRFKEGIYPILIYTSPCFPKFFQGTPSSPMLFSHTLSCLFLGIIVVAKETRDTITFDASIFGAKTQHSSKEAKIYLYT
jgi:hypothetical protein